jgi:hypothetical protein
MLEAVWEGAKGVIVSGVDDAVVSQEEGRLGAWLSMFKARGETRFGGDGEGSKRECSSD